MLTETELKYIMVTFKTQQRALVVNSLRLKPRNTAYGFVRLFPGTKLPSAVNPSERLDSDFSARLAVKR